MAKDRDPHNDGRTVAMLYVDRIDLDQDSPVERFAWNGREWRTETRVETAQTTWVTLHGRSVDQWYRRNIRGWLDFGPARYRWRSTDGGSDAPALVARALDEALRCEVA